MSAQVHALRVHSFLCRIWDELALRVEQLPADGNYPRPQIQQNGDNVLLVYPDCCNYVISADGSAVCEVHGISDNVSTADGAFRVAYDLARYMTSNTFASQLRAVGETLLDELDCD